MGQELEAMLERVVLEKDAERRSCSKAWDQVRECGYRYQALKKDLEGQVSALVSENLQLKAMVAQRHEQQVVEAVQGDA